MTDIAKAITAINSEAAFYITSENIDTIQWLNGTAVIPKSDIQAKQVELQAEYDAQEYARNRAPEYPAIGDQLDYIFHNGIAKWKTDMITPVKAKYPKPS